MKLNNLIFWKDKKVLITGHNGFKGSWLTTWLLSLGANIFGYSLDIEENSSVLHIFGADPYNFNSDMSLTEKDNLRQHSESTCQSNYILYRTTSLHLYIKASGQLKPDVNIALVKKA